MVAGEHKEVAAFVHSVERFIAQNGLLRMQGRYLVGFSGGPDSVALMMVLLALGYHVEAVHCNFHLRGEESNRDEQFCKDFCGRHHIPFHLVHFDTAGYARLHKVSIEMAARTLRYHYFRQLCADMQMDGICVAHHADDQVETVLLNMLRGTGINGLVGMRPRNGMVLRPLLGVTRVDIMAYLDAMGQSYVIDSTNLEDDVQRNKLRLDIIPLLEKVNPAAKRNILRMTENLAEVQTAMEANLKAEEGKALRKDPGSEDDACYDLSVLKSYVEPGLLLWHLLSPYGFNRTQVEEIGRGGSETRIWTSEGYVAVATRQSLHVIGRELWEKDLPAVVMPEAGIYKKGDVRCQVEAIDGREVSKVSDVATVDAGKVKFPLTLRPVRQGDRFVPYGMKGSKLVSDYLKDIKKSPLARKHQLLLADGNGHIVWLVGERTDDRCKITDGTRRTLRITVTRQC